MLPSLPATAAPQLLATCQASQASHLRDDFHFPELRLRLRAFFSEDSEEQERK